MHLYVFRVSVDQLFLVVKYIVYISLQRLYEHCKISHFYILPHRLHYLTKLITQCIPTNKGVKDLIANF